MGLTMVNRPIGKPSTNGIHQSKEEIQTAWIDARARPHTSNTPINILSNFHRIIHIHTEWIQSTIFSHLLTPQSYENHQVKTNSRYKIQSFKAKPVIYQQSETSNNKKKITNQNEEETARLIQSEIYNSNKRNILKINTNKI